METNKLMVRLHDEAEEKWEEINVDISDIDFIPFDIEVLFCGESCGRVTLFKKKKLVRQVRDALNKCKNIEKIEQIAQILNI